MPDTTAPAQQRVGASNRTQARVERHRWAQAKRADREYGIKLRAVARNIGDLVKGLWGSASAVQQINEALHAYAELLRPWAKVTATAMLADVERRDAKAWADIGKRMYRALHREIRLAPTAPVFNRLLEEQVDLITSLPREAAERVQRLAAETYISGGRAKFIEAEIMRSGDVTAARATLIARTEVGRAATALTETRARAVGSEGYIWRTARDVDVRKMHKDLEGTFHRWDDPPVAETGGQRHHPGAFPNCRCYCEPVTPDLI